MKVYLVWSDEYEDTDVEGVFSSLELAEQFVENNWRHWHRRCWIESWIVDDESVAYDKYETIMGWSIDGYRGEEKELRKWEKL